MRARISVSSPPFLSQIQPRTSTNSDADCHEVGWSMKKWQKSVSKGKRSERMRSFQAGKEPIWPPLSVNRHGTPVRPVKTEVVRRPRAGAENHFALGIVRDGHVEPLSAAILRHGGGLEQALRQDSDFPIRT